MSMTGKYSFYWTWEGGILLGNWCLKEIWKLINYVILLMGYYWHKVYFIKLQICGYGHYLCCNVILLAQVVNTIYRHYENARMDVTSGAIYALDYQSWLNLYCKYSKDMWASVRRLFAVLSSCKSVEVYQFVLHVLFRSWT